MAPSVIAFVGLPGLKALLAWVRWPLLALLSVFGLSVIYRFAPSRKGAKWRWISPGAVVATVLWLVGTIGFSIYPKNFGSYNETYGALGGVIMLLTWLWLSAFIVLLGAELNSEMERQTRRDLTSGPPEVQLDAVPENTGFLERSAEWQGGTGRKDLDRTLAIGGKMRENAVSAAIVAILVVSRLLASPTRRS